MREEPVGVIGLGIMGSAMAASLMRAGYRVVGYDLLARCRRDHRESGGQAAPSCREVGNQSGIVVSSLPSSPALLQTAEALTRCLRPPRIVIETSTLPVVVKDQARKQLAVRGTTLLDCPLSGTGAQAHYYLGRFGAGSKMKFVANLLVAIHNVAAAEALVLATKAGLDPAMALKVLGDGAGSSRMLQVRGPMMVTGDYADAMMKLEVWQKDMTIIADFARKTACPTPLFAASAPIYLAALARGRGHEDTAAVCAILEGLANIRRRTNRARTRR